jgi:hypothetical protein
MPQTLHRAARTGEHFGGEVRHWREGAYHGAASGVTEEKSRPAVASAQASQWSRASCR